MNGLRVAVRCPIGAVLLKMVNFLGGAVYALGRSLPISTMLNPPSKGRVGIRQVCRKPFHKAAFPLDMKSIPPMPNSRNFACTWAALSGPCRPGDLPCPTPCPVNTPVLSVLHSAELSVQYSASVRNGLFSFPH